MSQKRPIYNDYPSKYSKKEGSERSYDYKKFEESRDRPYQEKRDLQVRSTNSGWNKKAGTVEVYVNNFILEKSKEDIYVLSYHVECPSVDSQIHFHKTLREKFKDMKYIYDGASYLFTLEKDVCEGKGEIDFPFENQIIKVKRINDSKTEFSLVYNNLMKEVLHQLTRAKRDKTEVTRKFIKVNSIMYDLKSKKDIGRFPAFLLKGYKGSVNPFGFLVNIVYKSFSSQHILQSLRDRVINTSAKNFWVMPTYNQRVVKVDGFDTTKSVDFQFEKNGQMITLLEYYSKSYNIPIKDKHQPLMYKTTNKGTVEYFIPELCSLVGVPDAIRNDMNFKKEWKFGTTMDPTKRFNEIEEFVRKIKDTKEIYETVQKWGVNLHDKMSKIESNLLAPPLIQFGKQETQQMVEFDIRNQKIYAQPEFKKAKYVIYIEPYKSEGKTIDDLLNMIEKNAKELDFDIQKLKTKTISCKEYGERGYVNAIRNIMESYVREEIAFFFLILSDRKCYKGPKQELAKIGIPSQAILLSTFQKTGALSKCTKLNIQQIAKYGGLPWKISNPLEGLTKACYIGMDYLKNSLAFVATLGESNLYHSRYGSSSNLIDFLDETMILFKDLNGDFPETVIFYRLGLDSSKCEDEIACVEKVFDSKECKNGKINYIYFLTNKAPNHRFWSLQKTNVDAGTVIGVSGKEFYMVSVYNYKTTSIPTKFQVIKSTLNHDIISMADIQKTTYSLCYCYYNWFGAIKVPMVCQYASRLAKFHEDIIGSSLKQSPLDQTLYYI